MKKRVFALLTVLLLALSVLQIRAPIALGYSYSTSININHSPGSNGSSEALLLHEAV